MKSKIRKIVTFVEETHTEIRDEVQIAMKQDGIAAVSDNPMAVPGLFIESMRHGVQPVIRAKQARMHQPGCLRPQDLRAFDLSILQMSDHESRHVAGGGR